MPASHLLEHVTVERVVWFPLIWKVWELLVLGSHVLIYRPSFAILIENKRSTKNPTRFHIQYVYKSKGDRKELVCGGGAN